MATRGGLRGRLQRMVLGDDLARLLAEALSAPAQLNEPGWIELSGTGSSNDAQVASKIDRKDTNLKARWYYHNDPSAAQAVRLYNVFTFGQGVSVKAADECVAEVVDTFWQDPRNRAAFTSAEAQWRLNRDRLLDGEVFFVFYVSTTTGRVVVRTLDPNEIHDVIPHETDPAMPAYYKRVYTPQRYDFTRGEFVKGDEVTEYLPDFRNADVRPEVKAAWPAGTEVSVMHVCSNPLNGRGLSHLATALPWIKAFKGFMEDRAVLTLALATFAFKHKISGNRQAVKRVLEQWGDYETSYRYGLTSWQDRRPAAQTLVENQASDIEQLKTDTGASNAYLDARLFRQQVGIGAMGLFEPFMTGDPSTGNLASHTVMGETMERQFAFEQQLWRGVFGDILWLVLLSAARFGGLRGASAVVDETGGYSIWRLGATGDVDLTVDVDFPPPVKRDITQWSAALASIAQAEAIIGQALMPPREKAAIAMGMFGVDNVEQAIAELEAQDFAMPTATLQQPMPAQEGVREIVRALAAVRADEIGEPLPSEEAQKAEPVTEDELAKMFDWFKRAPTLDELIKRYGLDHEQVEEAQKDNGHA